MLLLLPWPVAAQTGAPTTDASAEGVPASESPADGDIVVTAQRRSERLSEVPIAITAFTASSLGATGANDARTLTTVTPGLNFQSSGSSAQPVIRGIGSSGSSIGDSSNVAIYIDGVYQPFQAGNFLRFVDMERIEVLKGPQGTLFGRNAAGGAISVTTQSPSLATANGHMGISYARFGEVQANGFVSVPVTGNLAASLAADYTRSEGFRRDQFLDRRLGYVRSGSVRGKLLFEPADGVEILATGHYDNTNDLTTFGNQPLDGNTAVRAQVPGIQIPVGTNRSTLNLVPLNRVKTTDGSVRITLDTPMGTLTSLSAFSRARQYVLTDSDLTPAAFSQSRIRFGDDMISQDLTLASSDRTTLRYLMGGTFYSERGFYALQSFGGLLTPGAPPLVARLENPQVKIDAVAIFAEVTWSITNRLTFVGGARYSNDSIGYTGQSFSPTTGAALLTLAPRATFAKVTPRTSLRYQLSPGLNVYASYTQGFKSGVFNAAGLAGTAVRPEKVDAFEVGAKGSLPGALSFDASTFFYDYRDLQLSSFGANAVQPILRNAASARIYGVEGNIRTAPMNGLGLRAGASYTHGEYVDFPGAQGFRLRTDAAGVPIGGNTTFNFDGSGQPLIRTPRLQVNGTLSYESLLPGRAGSISANLTGSYSSRIYYDVTGTFSQAPFAIVNANLAYTTADRHWRATAFGTNVLDETYIVGALVSSLATAVTYARPATYGLRLEYLF